MPRIQRKKSQVRSNSHFRTKSILSEISYFSDTNLRTNRWTATGIFLAHSSLQRVFVDIVYDGQPYEVSIASPTRQMRKQRPREVRGISQESMESVLTYSSLCLKPPISLSKGRSWVRRRARLGCRIRTICPSLFSFSLPPEPSLQQPGSLEEPPFHMKPHREVASRPKCTFSRDDCQEGLPLHSS